jgi:hypothetical protein
MGCPCLVVFETWESGTYASWLTILDLFIRESLAIEVGQRLKGEDVVGVLNQIRGMRGSQCWMVQAIGREINFTRRSGTSCGNWLRHGGPAFKTSHCLWPCPFAGFLRSICALFVGLSLPFVVLGVIR